MMNEKYKEQIDTILGIYSCMCETNNRWHDLICLYGTENISFEICGTEFKSKKLYRQDLLKLETKDLTKLIVYVISSLIKADARDKNINDILDISF